MRQRDVTTDQRGHAAPPEVLEGHPELEPPEAPRLLETVLRVPRETAEALALLGPEVGRHEAPRVPQEPSIPDERASALHWHREPLMRVERQGGRAPESCVASREVRVRGADGSVGAVDVEPEILGLTESGHVLEGIDRPRVDGPRARRHAERPAPG